MAASSPRPATDHPFEDGGSVTDGRMSPSVFKRADQNPNVDLRFDARFRLPNVAVYKDWLLSELVAGHFWPHANSRAERGRAWALGGSLKMRFR